MWVQMIGSYDLDHEKKHEEKMTSYVKARRFLIGNCAAATFH